MKEKREREREEKLTLFSNLDVKLLICACVVRQLKFEEAIRQFDLQIIVYSVF